MKLITINGRTICARGYGRKMKGHAVERAMRNERRAGFNVKFTHPRSFRIRESVEP